MLTALTALTVYVIVDFRKRLDSVDRERKRLINKIMVREGSPQLFPDEEIEPDRIPAEKRPATPIRTSTPFRTGIRNLKESLNLRDKTEAGQNIPAEIKDKITDAAEKRRAQQNGNGAS